MSPHHPLARHVALALPLILSASAARAQVTSVALWRSGDAPQAPLAAAVITFDPSETSCSADTLANCQVTALDLLVADPGAAEALFDETDFNTLTFSFAGGVDFNADLVGQTDFTELSLSASAPAPSSASLNTLTPDGGAPLTLERLERVANAHLYPAVVNMSEDDTSHTLSAATIFTALPGAGSSLTSCAGASDIGTVSLPSVDLVFDPYPDVFGISTLSCVTDTSATIFFVVKVSSVNDLPAATVTTLTLDEDTTSSLDLTDVSDVEDAAADLIVAVSADGANGSASVVGDGSVSGSYIDYTPGAHFNGADSFSYTITDQDGGVKTINITVTVNPINDAPVANDDAMSVNEDDMAELDVIANDTDVDISREGDTLTLVGCAGASNGLLSASATPNTSIIYTPNPNFFGADSFTCTTRDVAGATDTATVTVTVNSVNDAPTAAPGSLTTDEDTPQTLDLAPSVIDIETADAGLTITITTPASSGAVTVSGTVVTYTPNANSNGADSFDYTVTDANGATATSSVSVTVNPINDAPVAAADVVTTGEDLPITIDVLANDTDVDTSREGDTLSFVSCGAASHGAVTANLDGVRVDYAPTLNYNGADSFTCTIRDAAGLTSTALVSVTITPTNDAPDAVPDNVTTPEDIAVTLNVLSNDLEFDGQTITLDSCTQGTSGATTFNAATGDVTYTPALNFNGSDSFSCTITDGIAQDIGYVSVNVTAVNDTPVATADSLVANEETAATVDLSNNVSDVETAANALIITVAAGNEPAHGVATVLGQTIQYTGDLDFVGADSFTYTVSDGVATSTAVVSVTVNNVNDAPVATADALTVAEDSSATVRVLDNDTDVDAGETATLTLVSCTNGTNGSVNANTGTGEATYTVTTPDYVGGDTFNCTIRDVNNATATAAVTVTVTPVNDLPTAADDTLVLNEDTTGSVDVSFLVSDVEEATADLIITVLTPPTHGTTSVTGQVITYEPAPDYEGADSLVYQVEDADGGVDTGTVTITVNNVNDAPVANSDALTVAEDSSATIRVLDNDTDVDAGETATLTLVSCTSGANGSVSANTATGEATYTATTLNYVGGDTFNCTIRDVNNATATAAVAVTVTPVNDAPTTSNSALTTDEDTLGALDVSGDLGDVEDAPAALTISIQTQPTNGVASVVGQTVRYLGDADYYGPDSFVYTVTDSGGLTANATVSVTVNPVNDAPVAADDALTLDEDSAADLDVTLNDTDVDGDALFLMGAGACSDPVHGVVTVLDATTVRYAPEADYFGLDSFDCNVTDGLEMVTATVFVTVTNVDDAPRPQDDSVEVREGEGDAFLITLNDLEVDGQSLWISSCADGAHGTTAVTGASVTYTHSGLSRQDDQFDCVVTDGALTATTTVFVDVIYCGDGVKQAPEECDDANLNNCDSCTNACQFGPDVTMVNVTGGDFTMGDKSLSASSPTRLVSVPDFQVSRAEVTVAQYRSCVKSGGCSTPGALAGCLYRSTPGANDSKPVNCVSWDQANMFMAWCLSDPNSTDTPLSLPTEAQWEYLAKESANYTYPGTNTLPSRSQAVYYATAPANVCTVGVNLVGGQRVQGSFNLCNIVGNVSEWTQDNYAAYTATSPTDGSAFVNGNNYNTIRGGSWASKRSNYLMSSYRLPLYRTSQRPEVGFRLSCSAHDVCGFTGEAP